ncbi:MAG: response regulator [Chitinophagales bacterium]
MKRSAKVLIIDDDRDLCFLLKNILQSKVEDVNIATTLEEGKQILSSQKPDVIFLDNNLSDGQGVKHISQFKSIVPEAKIILISAMHNTKEKALEHGADAFVEKPIVLATIQQFFNT